MARLVYRIVYRINQFWRGVSASVTTQERELAASVLPPAALPLFTQMPPDAQKHSLNVLASIWADGHDHPDLAVASLLHDCGKVAAAQGGVRLGLWLRGPLVVLEALLPRRVAAWASPEPAHGWRYALFVQREHAAIGAQWAAEAGCSVLSCWLIAHHQTPLSALDDSALEGLFEGGGDHMARTLLAILQQADEGN